MRAFFYDTWAFVALADAKDPHHALAEEADRWFEANAYAAVTSDYVFDETLTLLNAAGGAKVAILFAQGLMARVEAQELLLVNVGRDLREQAFSLFKKLAPEDRRLSFTDCTSFAVMKELDCTLAFTSDRHFHRAGGGIRPLLEREGPRLRLALP